MKKILCTMFVLAAIMCLVPMTALAVADNPLGSTVSEVPDGDTLVNNYGIVTANYGTIENNYGTVIENYGIVTNAGGGSVTSNHGTVYPVLVSSAPEALNSSYTGALKALVTAGTAENGTMEYALGADADTAPADGWSGDIPCGTDAGVYYVWYRGRSTDNTTVTAPVCVQAVISPAQLTIEGTTVSGKVYDGTTVATVIPGTLGNTISGDDVTIAAAVGTFETADAGENLRVEVTYTIQGADAANYLPPAGQSFCADISKRSVTLTSASGCKAYDGTPLTNRDILIGGDQFAAGEGLASCTITGSQTDVGASSNGFTYTLKENTKESNYYIHVIYGTLTVEAPRKTPPATGDNTAPGRWLALTCISLLALYAAPAGKRKRQ